MLRRALRTRFPLAATALFATSLLLFGLGVQAFAALQEASARTSVFALPGTGVSLEAARDAQRTAFELGSPGPLAFWSQDDGRVAANPRLGTRADVSVVHFEGDLRLLLPGLDAYPDTPDACVLTSAASEDLFGQPDAAGLSVQLDGKMLEVVDVVSNDRSLLIAAGDEQALFSRLTVPAVDADGFPVTEEALAAAGLRAAKLDYRGLALLVYCCLLPYPLVLAIELARWCPQGLAPARTSLPARLACATAAACGAVGATLAFASSLSAFGGYFPTRWSDAQAWQAAADAWIDGMRDLVFARQSAFDEQTMSTAVFALLLAAAALVVLVAAARHLCWRLALDRAAHAHRTVPARKQVS